MCEYVFAIGGGQLHMLIPIHRCCKVRAEK